MKKNIAVVTGGNSSEYVISVQSAQTIISNIDTDNYTPYRVEIKGVRWFVTLNDSLHTDIDKEDFSFVHNGEKIKFDCAYIIIHGTPGEDGKIQGYFDMLKIPYTSCDMFTSSITFNKHFCKAYLKYFGVSTARWMLVKKDEESNSSRVIEELGLPCFVKPNKGGSSFGVTKIKSEKELSSAITAALKEDDEVLVEEFIEGTELTCGVLKTRSNSYVFPVTEIVTENEFFDYEAKYTDDKTDEITPARISPGLEKECKQLSERIYNYLNCRGIVRIDYIHQNDKLYLLEVNTIPGMSQNSIVPKQIRAYNISIKKLLNEIIEDCFVNA